MKGGTHAHSNTKVKRRATTTGPIDAWIIFRSERMRLQRLLSKRLVVSHCWTAGPHLHGHAPFFLESRECTTGQGVHETNSVVMGHVSHKKSCAVRGDWSQIGLGLSEPPAAPCNTVWHSSSSTGTEPRSSSAIAFFTVACAHTSRPESWSPAKTPRDGRLLLRIQLVSTTRSHGGLCNVSD